MELSVFALIFLILIISLSIFFMQKKEKKKKKISKKITAANINIAVANPQTKKERASDKDSIIKEAESHFRTLSLKNPYSPLPFKVLAEFYIKNSLTKEAICKCEKMIVYLNKDLSVEKFSTLLDFLKTENRIDLVEKIETFYKSTE
jgi:ABC-type Na+ efflux pump permease subunit